MTKQSFLDQFYTLYNELTDGSGQGYQPIELNIVVSKVIEDIVLSKYKEVEFSEKRTEDLGELIKYKTYTSFGTGSLPNSKTITLPNTLLTSSTDYSDVYWFTIYEDVITNVLDCSIKNNTTVFVKAKVIPMRHGELIVALEDPFRAPYSKNNKAKVLRERSEGRIQSLITDGTFNITSYQIGYIKKPTPVDFTTGLGNTLCQLSDEMHTQILSETLTKCNVIIGEQKEILTEN